MVGSTINFVKTIEQYPCLYNNRIAEYTRKDITEQAWSEVAKKSNDSVYVCQSKWKNIRNGFVRSLKQPPKGSSEKQKKPHYLHKELQFIMPFIKASIHTKHVKKNTNPPKVAGEDESNSTSDESASYSEPVSNTSKKRKMSKVEIEVDVDEEPEWTRKKESSHNPREMFLFSLLPDIERLTEEQMRKFRIKMLLLLEEIQSKPLQEPQLYKDNGSSISKEGKRVIVKQERLDTF